MNKKLYFSIGGILLLILASHISARQYRVLSYGVDAYNAHYAIHGKRTASQVFTTKNTVVGIGAILVDMRRSNKLTDVVVTIKNTATNEHIATNKISKAHLQDDQFAYTPFGDTVIPPGNTIEVTFSAPDATSKNPIGLRFDPEKDALAIALIERAPIWKYFVTTIQNERESWYYVAIALLATCIIGLPVLFPKQKKLLLGVIAILLLSALLIRVAIIPQFGGVSGGDPYNYLFISQTISKLENPFANTKRLPGYPLILAPFLSSGMFDDQRVMRTIQTVASIVGIAFLMGIVRLLQLSWPVALGASTILAFQKDFFFTSTRPEPYTLYTALLLASLFLFFYSYTKKHSWIYVTFGFALGYGAMVRQEGFMLAAIVGACSLAYELYKGKSVRRFIQMYAPALLIVLPFFVHNALTYDHPLYTEYFEGERLQIVDSYRAFQDAAGASWGVIGSMWKPSWDSLERIELTNPVFLTSGLVLWVWFAAFAHLKLMRQSKVIAVGMWIAWIMLALWSIYAKTQFTSIFPVIAAGWMVASIPLFLIQTSWRGLVILLVLISQIGIATWFHPYPKHYQQSYPLLILMLATALISQIHTQKKLLSFSTLALTTLPFLIIAVYLSQNIIPMIDQYNESVALDSVVYRATRTAKNLPGPVGFDQAYLPARLYFDKNAKYFPAEENPTSEMEEEWLRNNKLQTIVIIRNNNVFDSIPDTWRKVQDFKAMGKDDELFVSTIYATSF